MESNLCVLARFSNLTVLAMICHIFVVDHDSIKFLIMQEKESEALYAIRFARFTNMQLMMRLLSNI